MPEAAENWATEQFPPDQRENLAGNTIWHWMVEGYRAGLAASPSEDALKIADKLALDPNREEYRLVHLVGAEYDEALCGNQPQMDDGMTIDDHLVTCRACLNALSDSLAALRTTKEAAR